MTTILTVLALSLLQAPHEVPPPNGTAQGVDYRIEARLDEDDYTLMIASSDEDPEREARYLRAVGLVSCEVQVYFGLDR
jgi:hypothetical protein